MKLKSLHAVILNHLSSKRSVSLPSIIAWAKDRHELLTDQKIRDALTRLEKENYVVRINGGYMKNPNGQLALKRYHEEQKNEKR